MVLVESASLYWFLLVITTIMAVIAQVWKKCCGVNVVLFSFNLLHFDLLYEWLKCDRYCFLFYLLNV